MDHIWNKQRFGGQGWSLDQKPLHPLLVRNADSQALSEFGKCCSNPELPTGAEDGFHMCQGIASPQLLGTWAVTPMAQLQAASLIPCGCRCCKIHHWPPWRQRWEVLLPLALHLQQTLAHSVSPTWVACDRPYRISEVQAHLLVLLIWNHSHFHVAISAEQAFPPKTNTW